MCAKGEFGFELTEIPGHCAAIKTKKNRPKNYQFFSFFISTGEAFSFTFNVHHVY
jgi:hypothetical protein